MARWDAALYTERLVKRETLEKIRAPAPLNNGTTHPYGFGWELDPVGSHRRMSHGGNWLGFSGQIDRYPDDELTVVALCNLSDLSLAKLTRAIAGTCLPELAPRVYTPIPDAEPAVTARLLDVLTRAGQGRFREDEFAPEIWAYIGPRAEQFKVDMAALGPIQNLTLVQRATVNGEASYRYQARFKNTSLIYHFVLRTDGRIAIMMPEDVNM
jgi:hypothetical protein